MKIDSNLLQGLAHLSRLELKGSQEAEMLNDLNNIIDWVKKLEEVPTEGVLPLTHMAEGINIFREDSIQEDFTHEQGLKNAPDADSSYFRVPKVME